VIHVDHDDAMALSMFWAGLMMVFTPLISAAVVVGVVWRQRAKEAQQGRGGDPRSGSERPGEG
jgi:hypothetical protein